MMNNVADNMLVDLGAETEDVLAATQTSAYFDMKEYDRCTFIIRLSDKVSAPDVDLAVKSAENAAGLNAEDIKTISLGNSPADGLYAVEVRARDLVSGKPFVALALTATPTINGDTIRSTIIAALHNPHHSFENLIGAVAVYKTWED